MKEEKKEWIQEIKNLKRGGYIKGRKRYVYFSFNWDDFVDNVIN